MPSYTLIDPALDLPEAEFGLAASDLGGEPGGWTVARRRLRGGRREGVDLVRVDNGRLGVTIVPTRGMGLWRVDCDDDRVGWDSPVRDGPVHPAFVDLQARGGLGWLSGFDELMVRCGLGHNGPPHRVGDDLRTLHGKVANLPAHTLSVSAGEGGSGPIEVVGVVDEAELFSAAIRLTARVSTDPGSNALTIRDEFANLGDTPATMQVLYHWNFGPPHLGDGSRFVAAPRAVCPRDARAAEGIGEYDAFGPPTPGFAEQAYYFDLIGDDEGRTVVLLRDRAGGRGVALRFSTRSLPCFTLWKNTGGAADGYVTGLEPGTNYPNPRPFEEGRGRVVTLAPGASYASETTLVVLTTAAEVAAIEAEVGRLRDRARPTIHPRPAEPFAAP